MPEISTGFVKRAAMRAGADLVGIASIDRFKHYPEERQPEHLLPDAKSVIVVGVDSVQPAAPLLYGQLFHEGGTVEGISGLKCRKTATVGIKNKSCLNQSFFRTTVARIVDFYTTLNRYYP